MIPAWNYKQVCRRLADASRSRYPVGSVRMVGFLFAPAQASLAKKEIVPSLQYFHHRSGDRIDFFCAGYSRYCSTLGQQPITRDVPPWMFSVEAFDGFRRDIESRSRWRYSGESDLLLMNCIRESEEGATSLDFGSTIVCDLDLMIRDRAIHSTRRFFEDVFQFAESTANSDPTWGFSDEMGFRVGGSALKRLILSLLPSGLGADYARAEHFAIRDVSVES